MKKITGKLIAGAVVGTGVAGATGAQAIPQIRNKEVLVAQKATEFFGVSDVNITPSAANTTVNVNGTETNVNGETKVLVNGDTVTYEIPYNVIAKNGKNFNIPDITATAAATLVYPGDSSTTNQTIAKGMADKITYTSNPQTNQTSSSSGMVQVSFKIPQTAVGMNFNPNITLHCGTENIPVALPNIKTTANYWTAISLKPKVDGNNIDLSGGISYGQNWKAKYNPYGKPITSITFYMGQEATMGKVGYQSISSPDLTLNSNGSYTLTGALLQEVMSGKNVPLFKITSNSPNGVITSVSAATSGATWNGIEEDHPNVTVYNNTNFTPYTHAPSSESTAGNAQMVPMSQTNSAQWGKYEDTAGTEGDHVTFGTTINPGIQGSWMGTTFNYAQGGYIAATKGGAQATSSNLNYVHLNAAGINIMDNGTPEQKYQLLSEIVATNNPTTNGPQNFQYGTIYGSEAMNGAIQGVSPGQNDPLTVYTGSPMNGNMKTYPIQNCQLVFTNPYTINNNSTTTNSNIATLVPNDSNSTIVSKTFTLGQSDGGTTNASNFGSLASTDYVNSGATGFMLGASNEYTPAYTDAESTFFHGGNGQSTSFRNGETSHNTASIKGSAWGGHYAAINGQTNFTEPTQWLNSTQNVELSIQRDSEIGGGQLDPNSSIVVNLGADATIAGPIKVGTVSVKPSDYKLEQVEINGVPQTEVIINSAAVIKANIFPTNTRNLQVSIPTKYDPNAETMKSITVSGYLQGTNSNPMGNIYQINGGMTSGIQIMGNVPLQSSTATVHLTSAVSNDCLHSVGPVNSNNVATLTDMVHNSSNDAKQYIVVGQFPTAGTNSSLPGNFGEPSEGGLSAEAQSFNNANCPVYVLPASGLNNTDSEGYTNKQIMEGTNPYEMKGAKSWIENPASGWVKYTPGMSLSGMVGYTYMPTIQPGADWTGSYNVQLTNVNLNIPIQYVTSQFKYFDTTDGVGSASNIVTINPNGVNLAQSWVSNVVLQEPSGNTRALTSEELSKEVTFNSVNGSQTQKLEYLNSKGVDNDGNFDPTPATLQDHLQQEVDLVNDEAALKAAGYELVGIKVKIGNGAWIEETPDFFQNTGIWQDTELTHILFVIKQVIPKYQDSVSVTVNDNPIPTNSSIYNDTTNHIPPQTGNEVEAGKDTGLSTPTAPAGYKITGVTVITSNSSGIVTSKTTEPATFTVPTTQGDANVHYIYNLTPVATPVTNTVKVYVQNSKGTTEITTANANDYEGGSNLAPQSNTGIDKANTNLKTPVIPKGYHIVSVTNQIGTDATVTEANGFKVPSTFGTKNNSTVYTIAPDKATLNVTVNELGPDGKTVTKVLENNVQTVSNGTYDEKVGTNGNYEKGIIPPGYKIQSITYNNNPVTQSVLPGKTLGSGSNNVVYNLVPDTASLTTTVVNDSTGKVIATLPTQTGTTGTAYNKTNYLPTGVNGDTYTQTVNGVTEHYKIVKVTNQVNNNPAEDITSNQGSLAKDTLLGNDKVVYHVVPEYHDSVVVNVFNPTTGKYEPVITETAKNYNGTNLAPQNGPYDVTNSKSGINTPTAPSGYKITGITVATTVDGETTTETIPANDLTNYKVPTSLSNGDVKVTYNMAPIANVTTQVIVKGDPTSDLNQPETTVEKNVVIDGNEKVDVNNYTVPAGYHLVSTTIQTPSDKSAVAINRTDINNTALIPGTTHVVYTIAKNASDSVNITYVTGNGKTEKVVVPTKEVNSNVPANSKEVVPVTVPAGYQLAPNTTANPTVTSNVTTGTTTTANTSVNVDTDTKGNQSVTVTTPNDNNNSSAVNITVHLDKVVKNTIKVEVENPNGTTTEITTVNVGNYQGGSNLIPQVSKSGIEGNPNVTEAGKALTAPLAPNGYHIIKVINTVEDPITNKVISTDTEGNNYAQPNTLGTEDNNTTYTIAPNSASLDVTVTEVNAKGEKVSTLESPTVTISNAKGHYGEAIGNNGEPNTAVQNDITSGKYKVVSVTLNGKILSLNDYQKEIADGTLDASNGQNHVVYNVQPITGTVSVKVVTLGGKTVVANKQVQEANVGTTIANYGEPTLPAGYKNYHLVKTTIQTPNDKTAVETTANDLAKDTVVAGNTQIVYTIAKNSTSTTTVKYQTPNGVIVPGTKVTTTTVPGGTPENVPVTVPKGYKLVPKNPVTVNGTPVTPGKDGNVPVNTGTPEKGTTNHVVITVEPIVHDSVSTTVNGKTVQEGQPGYVPSQTGEANVSGNPSGIHDIKVPNGYHINGITVITTTPDGKVTTTTVSADKIASYNVPTTLGKDNVHVTYNLVPNPVKKYTTKITVTTPNGVEVPGIPAKTVTTPAGDTVTGTGITVPKAYKIVKVTVDGKDVTPTTMNGETNVPVITHTNSDHTVHYVIEKTPTKPVVKDGNVTVEINTTKGVILTPAHEVESGDVGNKIDSGKTGIVVPVGYQISSATVDGKPVKITATTETVNGKPEIVVNVPTGNYVNGTTKIVYTVSKETPKTYTTRVTVTTPNGVEVPEIPAKTIITPAGDNVTGTGITVPKGYKIVKVTVDGNNSTTATNNGVTNIPTITNTNGDHTVHYVIEKIPAVQTGSVTVKVVNDTTGNTVVEQHTVDTGNVGTTATGTEYTPTGNSKIKYVTVNGETVPLSLIPHLSITDGVTNIVYHLVNPAPVVQTGKVRDTVETKNGTIVVPTTTTEGNVGDNISAGSTAYTNVPGYHVVGLTVNGQSIEPNANGTYSVPAMTYNNGTQNVVWIVAKNQEVKPEAKKGSVTVEVKTTTGKILVPETTVTSGAAGTEVNSGIGYNPINGYHLVGTTVNGNSEGVVSVSQVTLTDGVTKIVYIVSPDETPNKPTTPTNPTKPTVQTGNVKVTVIDTNGTTVVGTHTVDSGEVGNTVTGDGYTPTDGNKIVKITVNGVAVNSLSGLKIAPGTTNIVYTIGKDTTPNTKPDTGNDNKPAETGKVSVTVNNENGDNIVPTHIVDSGNVGNEVTGDGYTPTAGNKIIKITVNGVTVNSLSGLKIALGTTKIVYTIGSDTPVVKPDTKPTTKPVVKPDTKPVVKPNTDQPEVIKPVVTQPGNNTPKTSNPSLEGNTSGGNVVNNPVESPNLIPVVNSSNKGSAKIETLPDTGLSNNGTTTEKAAEAVGLLSVLSLAFLLRKKK